MSLNMIECYAIEHFTSTSVEMLLLLFHRETFGGNKPWCSAKHSQFSRM